jgi:protein ImuB
MFACLYLPPPVNRAGRQEAAEFPHPPYLPHPAYLAQLTQLARDFSPRVETHGDRVVTLDVSGLGSLLGEPRAIGEALRRTAADRNLRVHVAIASTTTAVILLAQAHAGLIVIPAGEEAKALAPLPLSALKALKGTGSLFPVDAAEKGSRYLFHRWGLRTLGDLAALPSSALSERLGQEGLVWQRWARGEDARPLVPAGVEEPFEESLALEWPIDGLEPLSFVLARLCDPLCERLEHHDRGAVVLHVKLTLVTRQVHARSLQLPAPMRDARVLRTLALLDLESHPPPAAIDRVTVSVDVTEGRVLQFGLFARALPTERLATLLARLGALMGSDRVGAPALVDSHRPGAFAMAEFAPSAKGDGNLFRESSLKKIPVPFCLRRFRSPIPARVTIEQDRPVRVLTDARGFSGGNVVRSDGPWRSSGNWWVSSRQPHPAHLPWNCDEWDVVLSDGAAYRISHARSSAGSGRGTWFVDGMLD